MKNFAISAFAVAALFPSVAHCEPRGIKYAPEISAALPYPLPLGLQTCITMLKAPLQADIDADKQLAAVVHQSGFSPAVYTSSDIDVGFWMIADFRGNYPACKTYVDQTQSECGDEETHFGTAAFFAAWNGTIKFPKDMEDKMIRASASCSYRMDKSVLIQLKNEGR